MDNLFGNVSLFTLGDVSDKWDASDTDELVSAADGRSIDEKAIIRFSIVVHLDDQGQKTGHISFIDNKREVTHPFSDFGFELGTLLPNLQQHARAVIGQMCFQSIYEQNYCPNESMVGIYSLGEGGEIRVDNETQALVPGSFLVCVSRYPACNFSVDKNSSYGVDLGDQDPDESQDYGLLMLKPNSESIEAEFTGAMEYLKDHSSVNLLLNLIEKWNTTSIGNTGLAWKAVLDNIEKDRYPPAHIKAARIARFVLNDASLYQAILDRVINLCNTGFINYTFGIKHVASEWSDTCHKSPEEILSLMETCIPRLSIDDPSEVCGFIEDVGGNYSGLRLGNLDLAKRALAETLGRIQDAKVRTKFKTKGDKTLKSIS